MIRSRRRPIDVLACFLFASASFACGSGGNATVDARQSVETEVVVCDRAPDGRVTEYHVLPAINHKLASFPDFAAEIGMTAATDCQSARDFETAYRRYSEEHPGFDDDEPAMPIPWMDAPPMDERPDPSVSKIQGGNPPGELGAWPNQAVVYLRSKASGMVCTGTFIAKNWIATAAHCLDLVPGPTDLHPPENFTDNPWGPGATPALRLWGYSKWTIKWTDAAGAITPDTPLGDERTLKEASVLQYPDPAFRGSIPGSTAPNSSDDEHDFAMLFLHPALYDLVLPPDPETSAMAIGLRVPTGEEDWSVAGYSTDQLRTKHIPPSCPVVPCNGTVIRQVQTNMVSIRNGPNEPRLCFGDSGGPLYRMLDLGLPRPVLILDGVFSNTNAPGGCSPEGGSDLFRRVDRVKDYIERAMRMWNGANFSCRAVTNDYARCWGKPCTGAPDDTACFSDETCSGSGFSIDPIGLETCSQCPNGDCSCIRGQCLKFDN